jgi:hypothetical protein
VDDAIAARLQFAQDPRQRRNRARLNVVQQQDAFALFLQPLHRKLIDPIGRDVAPVVGEEIGAPELKPLGRGKFLDPVVDAQAGNAEERRGRSAVGQRRGHRRDALFDLLPGAVERQPIHAARMVLSVGGHRVAGVAHLAHAFRIGVGLASDQEEGRLRAVGGENLEDLVRVFRQRTVVEGQHDLTICKRQRLVILHGADDGMRARIDNDGARRTDGVGMV